MSDEIEVFLCCPSCGERKFRLGDGDPVCSNCSWTERAEVAADSYAHSRYPSWKHHRDGVEDEIGTCEDCGYNAVAPLHESDRVGGVRQKLRALNLEPGAGDGGFGICLCCGEVSVGKPLRQESGW